MRGHSSISLKSIHSLCCPLSTDSTFPTVYNELAEGGVPPELSALTYERIAVDEKRVHASALDLGESAALLVAKDHDAILLTDDLAARDAAIESGIDVHGSVGVIALGYARGRLDKGEATTLMRALQRETSLFVTDAVIERGIALLDRR